MRTASFRSRWVHRAAALTIALTGCSNAPSSPAAPVPIPAVSYDGQYVGTIRVTQSVQYETWCNTNPDLNLSVSGNSFSYTLTHPTMPQGTMFNPMFDIQVAPDGSFNGSSNAQGIATMTGRISGRRLEGQIQGSACGYAFSADRI